MRVKRLVPAERRRPRASTLLAGLKPQEVARSCHVSARTLDREPLVGAEWSAEWLCRGSVVFVDEAAQDVTAPDVGKGAVGDGSVV